MQFRELTAEEIECRVATVTEKGCSLLLYKDARCDMRILDEAVGPMNWQRSHTRDNANCVVSIWDDAKKQWISKEDTGTESYTEKEKGLASDSFKRACFNWGIGRELYTAPFIWISAADANVTQKNGKWTTSEKFVVSGMTVENGNIVALEIKSAKTNKVVYSFGSNKVKQDVPKEEPVNIEALKAVLDKNGIDIAVVFELYKIKSFDEINQAKYTNILKNIEKIKQKQEGKK